MAFTFLLCDAGGQAVTRVQRVTERKVVVSRNDQREATLKLNHYDPEAAALFSILAAGTPQLRVYEDEDLWFSGYFMGNNEQLALAQRGSDFSLLFLCPFGRLKAESGRYVATSDTPLVPGVWSYAQVDQGAIAWDLIERANAVASTGIREGTVEATVLRDRTYDGDKNVGEAIMDLSRVIDGFDFDLEPLDPTLNAGSLAEFNVYARQGSDLDDVIFGAGDGTVANVDIVTRQITPPANWVRAVSGSQGTDAGLESIKFDSASIAKYGMWERAIRATDVVDQGTLDAKATDALRPEWTRTIGFKPNPVLAPQPMADYWVGDRVSFYVREGAMVDQMTARVNQITVSLDENDNEDFTVSIEQEAVV